MKKVCNYLKLKCIIFLIKKLKCIILERDEDQPYMNVKEFQELGVEEPLIRGMAN